MIEIPFMNSDIYVNYLVAKLTQQYGEIGILCDLAPPTLQHHCRNINTRFETVCQMLMINRADYVRAVLCVENL